MTTPHERLPDYPKCRSHPLLSGKANQLKAPIILSAPANVSEAKKVECLRLPKAFLPALIGIAFQRRLLTVPLVSVFTATR